MIPLKYLLTHHLCEIRILFNRISHVKASVIEVDGSVHNSAFNLTQMSGRGKVSRVF